MTTILHLICPICFYDLAEWGTLLEVDRVAPDSLHGWIGDELHVYQLRSSGTKCDYDNHMYLANAKR